MDTTNFTNQIEREEQENELNENIRMDEEDHGFDSKRKYQPEPASEKQHKYLAYLCYTKGITQLEKGMIQDKFVKHFKLWSFSSIDKDQMSGVIDYVNRYWKKGQINKTTKLFFTESI